MKEEVGEFEEDLDEERGLKKAGVKTEALNKNKEVREEREKISNMVNLILEGLISQEESGQKLYWNIRTLEEALKDSRK